MTDVIVAEGISHSYGGRHALREVTFAVPRGAVAAVLGRNGSGKTTALSVLAGFLAPTTGAARVLGTDPRRGARGWRARIGLVLQSTSLDYSATVAEWLAVMAAAFPSPLRVDEVLELAELRPTAARRIGALSGGQQRRVDLATALIGGPEVLFLDEPTTGLDPESRRRLWSVITGLAASGTTIVLSTHHLDEVDALADRVLVLADGCLVADTTPQQLRRGPSTLRLPVPFQLPAAAIPDGFTATTNGRGVVLSASATEVAAHLDAVLGLAARYDLDLSGLRVQPPSLEDAYLDLTAARDRA